MSTDVYKLALERAMADLAVVLEKRDELEAKREHADTEVDNLRTAIFGLVTLAGEDAKSFPEQHPDLFPELIAPDTGLTDAVRQVLEVTKPTWQTAVSMREALTERQYDLSSYKNVLASLHTILKRLLDNDEVYSITRGGKNLYRWKAPSLRKSK